MFTGLDDGMVFTGTEDDGPRLGLGNAEGNLWATFVIANMVNWIVVSFVQHILASCSADTKIIVKNRRLRVVQHLGNNHAYQV